MIKSKTTIPVVIVLLAVGVLLAGGCLFLWFNGQGLADQAQDRSNTNLDQLEIEGVTELTRQDELTCNRLNWYSPSYCEATDTRVYAVDGIEDFDSKVTAKMQTNGWQGDFEENPHKYFFYRQNNIAAPVEGNAVRYANDNATGQAIKGNIRIVGTKQLPLNDDKAVQNTRFHYSNESLKRALQEHLQAGRTLVIVTAYSYYEKWF